jgi:hypothetical protein
MRYKNLECFEFFKSLFLIFENDAQTLNILLLFLELNFQKIKNHDLENSKDPEILNAIRFLYKKFNEHDKSKFKNNLIYFFILVHGRFS